MVPKSQSQKLSHPTIPFPGNPRIDTSTEMGGDWWLPGAGGAEGLADNCLTRGVALFRRHEGVLGPDTCDGYTVL